MWCHFTFIANGPSQAFESPESERKQETESDETNLVGVGMCFLGLMVCFTSHMHAEYPLSRSKRGNGPYLQVWCCLKEVAANICYPVVWLSITLGFSLSMGK